MFHRSSIIEKKLTKKEEQCFKVTEPKQIASTNWCLQQLDRLSILTAEMRRKTLDIAINESTRFWPFTMHLEDAFQFLEKMDCLNAENAYALIKYHSKQDMRPYKTDAYNLAQLHKLKLSTAESRRIVVRYEDSNAQLVALIKLFHDKDIALTEKRVVELEKFTDFIASSYDGMGCAIMRKLNNFVNQSEVTTFDDIKAFLLHERLERMKYMMPPPLRNKKNLNELMSKVEYLHELYWFMYYLKGKGKFTQENFDQLLRNAHVLQWNSVGRGEVYQLGFDAYIKMRETSCVAQQSITLHQGARDKENILSHLPDDLLKHLTPFLVSLPHKNLSIFNRKTSTFHEKWVNDHNVESGQVSKRRRLV